MFTNHMHEIYILFINIGRRTDMRACTWPKCKI